MHDGSLPTLEAVVVFYDRGGIDNENRSPLLAPLGLDAAEKAALVAFLKTLTGDNAEVLARDARSASATLPVPTRDPANVYMESLQKTP
jgi:cytochrome c peroxidase